MSGINTITGALGKQGFWETVADSLGDRTDPEAIAIRTKAAMEMKKAQSIAQFGEAEFETEISYVGLSTQILKARA